MLLERSHHKMGQDPEIDPLKEQEFEQEHPGHRGVYMEARPIPGYLSNPIDPMEQKYYDRCVPDLHQRYKPWYFYYIRCVLTSDQLLCHWADRADVGWITLRWNLLHDLRAQVRGGKWYSPWEDILESLHDRKSEPFKLPSGTVQEDGQKEVKAGKTFSQASTIPATPAKSGPTSGVSVQQKADFKTQLKEFQRKLVSTPAELT